MAAVLASGLTASGCRNAAPQAVELTVCRHEHAASAATHPLVIQPARFDSRLAALAGAVNETLSFTVRLGVVGGRVDDVCLRATPLKSEHATIQPEAIQIFRMHRVRVPSWPGWHIRTIPADQRIPEPFDALVPIDAPRGGLPATLEQGKTMDFWVDVTIPKGSFVGEHLGSLQLTSGDRVLDSLDIRLTVWPIILPEDADRGVIVDVDHRSLFAHHVFVDGAPHAPASTWRDDPNRDALDAVLSYTMRMLRRHGVNPVLAKLYPVVKINRLQHVLVDWEQYDATVGPLLDGTMFFNRIPLSAWPIPIDADFPPPPAYGASSSVGYSTALGEYLSQCARHFDEKGWLERSYTMVPSADSPGLDAIRATEHFSRLIRRADERLAILSRLFPQDLAPYGWTGFPFAALSDRVDIWMPDAQFYDARRMRDERVAGRRTWVSLDRPPYCGSVSIAAPATDNRAIAWQERHLDAEFVHAGLVNGWPAPVASPLVGDERVASPLVGDELLAADPQACVTHDPNVLIYPGTPFGLNVPVPSVRLKRLRRGLQDAAYLRLLRKRNLAHVADALTASLVQRAGAEAYHTHYADTRPTGWSHRGAIWESARRIMADELTRPRTELSPSKTLASTDVQWHRFMSAARSFSAEVEGVRVNLVGAPGTGEMQVDFVVTLDNGLRGPLGGGLRFARLPLGWSASRRVNAVEPVPPGASRRFTLTASASVMSSTMDGSVTVPVVFEGETGIVLDINARVSYLTAMWLESEIAIDGDLNDWPGGVGNVASGFAPICGQSSGTTGTSSESSRDTICLVARDVNNLYVALNCRTSGGGESRGSRRNTVVYDDLVPVGSEAVELLFDPLNAGTRSPADLYHVVINRFGASVAEKGVKLSPPGGRHQRRDR